MAAAVTAAGSRVGCGDGGGGVFETLAGKLAPPLTLSPPAVGIP